MMAAPTIYALASAPGRAGVAVVRISGPAAGAALDRLTGLPRPVPRQAMLRVLRDPDEGDVIDRGLVLWFPAPGSFTGEDVVELQVHGGPAVIRRLLAALGRVPGCRPADAGEFTRRAFLGGRLDLGQVEGLADLVAAETEAQRKAAMGAFAGRLGAAVAEWRARLVDITAVLEAAIDFADEADVPDAVALEATGALASLIDEVTVALDRGERGERLREGLVVVLTGAPNVGKSSLINRIAGRDVAIVTALPGTTRDALEVQLDLGGWPVLLVDTAGLRESNDPIEQEGIARARRWLTRCDLVLEIRDAKAPESDVAAVMAGGRSADVPVWRVRNKADLGPVPADEGVPVSAVTGAGIAELLSAIERFAADRLAGADSAVVVNARQRFHAQTALAALVAAAGAIEDRLGVEIVAEHVQEARQALAALVGRVGVDEWLDVVFSRFCIGK